MSGYTGTKAQTGLGSTLSIGSPAVLIGEVRSTAISASYGTVDVSNYQSVAREWIATLKDNGTCKISGSRVSSDVGQVAVEGAFASGLVQPFTLVLDKTPVQVTSGDTYTFNAIVEERAFTVAADKEVDYSLSLKISNGMTLVQGA
jgi:predicted secreted protein